MWPTSFVQTTVTATEVATIVARIGTAVG